MSQNVPPKVIGTVVGGRGFRYYNFSSIDPHPKSLSLMERDLKSIFVGNLPFSLTRMRKGLGVEG
jgi:hypothetical protein